MKHLFGNLFANFIAGLWLLLKVAQGDIFQPISDVSYCFKTSSRVICFETSLDGSSGTIVRVPFKEANRRCKAILPGYSFLTAIDSLEEYKTAVEIFIAGQSLQNETIIKDGRMLSESESQTWSWVNGQPYSPDVGPSKDVMDRVEQIQDAACVEVKRGQPLTYCFDNASSKLSFICENSGKENSFITTGIILLILLFVAVVIIIVVVVFVIRKRKHDRRHEQSPMENIKQSEKVNNVHATVVPGNGLSEGPDPAGSTMYAEVDMSKGPTTSSTIDASVQPTSEATDMGKNVVYAERDLPEKTNKSQ